MGHHHCAHDHSHEHGPLSPGMSLCPAASPPPASAAPPWTHPNRVVKTGILASFAFLPAFVGPQNSQARIAMSGRPGSSGGGANFALLAATMQQTTKNEATKVCVAPPLASPSHSLSKYVLTSHRVTLPPPPPHTHTHIQQGTGRKHNTVRALHSIRAPQPRPRTHTLTPPPPCLPSEKVRSELDARGVQRRAP